MDSCYIKGSVFDRFECTMFDVVGYVDFDHTGDRGYRHSTISYIYTLYEGAISGKASSISVVIFSTTKPEYVAAVEGVKEATWLWGLVVKVGSAQSTTIVFFDSQNVICLTKNDVYHSKTKHASVKYHFTGDTTPIGEIVVKKIHTLDNLTDMLVKSLPTTRFKHYLDLISIYNI